MELKVTFAGLNYKKSPSFASKQNRPFRACLGDYRLERIQNANSVRQLQLGRQCKTFFKWACYALGGVLFAGTVLKTGHLGYQKYIAPVQAQMSSYSSKFHKFYEAGIKNANSFVFQKYEHQEKIIKGLNTMLIDGEECVVVQNAAGLKPVIKEFTNDKNSGEIVDRLKSFLRGYNSQRNAIDIGVENGAELMKANTAQDMGILMGPTPIPMRIFTESVSN